MKGLQVLYLWVDGIYVKAGLEKEKAAVLTLIAGLSDGRKEILHLESGYRESKESWAALLRDLKERGMEDSKLDLGIWAALPQVFPHTREQRCWNHKVVNVVDQVPTKKRIEAKMMGAAIPYSATREDAEKGRGRFEAWASWAVFTYAYLWEVREKRYNQNFSSGGRANSGVVTVSDMKAAVNAKS